MTLPSLGLLSQSVLSGIFIGGMYSLIGLGLGLSWGLLRQINLGADKVIFTRARQNPRALEPTELLQKFNEVSGKMAQIAPTLDDALNLASRAVSREDLICVTGSLYLVGEAKKYLADRMNKRAKQTV